MKKILIILGCLVFTGCNVEYNVMIDDNLKVVEEAIVMGDDELYESSYRTSRNKVLEGFLDIYGMELEQNSYQYELIKGENPYVKINRQYNNIGDYIDSSKLFNDYFDKIDYKVDNNIIKIETIGFHHNITDDPERFYVDNLDIAIKLPFKVINHNASNVDEKSNTYYFTLKSQTEDFKLLLEFDSSKKFSYNDGVFIKILIIIGVIVLTWVIIYYLGRQKKYKV